MSVVRLHLPSRRFRFRRRRLSSSAYRNCLGRLCRLFQQCRLLSSSSSSDILSWRRFRRCQECLGRRFMDPNRRQNWCSTLVCVVLVVSPWWRSCASRAWILASRVLGLSSPQFSEWLLESSEASGSSIGLVIDSSRPYLTGGPVFLLGLELRGFFTFELFVWVLAW